MGKLVVLQGAIEGTYTVRDAAVRLKVGERRIKTTYEEVSGARLSGG